MGLKHDHRFRHEAMFYDDRDRFVEGCSSFIEEGIGLGEAILVVVPGYKIPWLRSSLNGGSDRVHFADMADVGANPARIIPAWLEFVEEQTRQRRGFRGIGEPIFVGRTDDELAECRRHEALLNVAFEDSPAWRLLCPYDTAQLHPSLIAEARRTHPLLIEGGSLRPSDMYPGTETLARPFQEPLPPPPKGARSLRFSHGDLNKVRHFVIELAAEAGMEDDNKDALILAVNEVATNSLRYGGGEGVAAAWVRGSNVLCQISDRGFVEDPLVGRIEPDPGGTGGRGLWMVNHLCSLVQQRSTARGTVTRMHMPLSGS